MASGNEQTLAIARLGQKKVNKNITIPKEYGAGSYVLNMFLDKWKDELRRRLKSDEGAEVIAREWEEALQNFDSRVITVAVRVAKQNYGLPPKLPAFVSICEQVLKQRAKTPNREAAVSSRDREMDKISGLLSLGC